MTVYLRHEAVVVDARQGPNRRRPARGRSRSVAPPPTPDGTCRIIDVDGVDRQACGRTHLTNTAQSRPIRITKIENKGHHNRRVRFQFADLG